MFYLAISTSSDDSSEEKDEAVSEQSDTEEKTEVVKIFIVKTLCLWYKF